MKKIEDSKAYEVVRFDGVSATSVYTGDMTRLVLANDKLKWRIDAELQEYTETAGEVLTLQEIADQLKNYHIITVVCEAPLSGRIYQYGNYGDEWWDIGDFAGYA